MEENDEHAEYAADLRRRKDDFFLMDEESPLGPEEKAAFSGLKYFPYDANYRVNARLVPLPQPEHTGLKTSKGFMQVFHKLGYFEFELQGKTAKLYAFRSPQGLHSDEYFILFRDATSGNETYARGRYLEVSENAKTASGLFILDFNFAYNPYCAYVDRYACPLPPEENVLDIAIRAGEIKYKEPVE